MERLGGIVVALVIVGGLIFWRFSEKGGNSSEVHDIAVEMLESTPNWESHQTLYVQWLDEHHETCFEQYYDMGGRRQSASFDEFAYWNDLFPQMAASADRDGYDNCAEHIRALHAEFMGFTLEEEEARDG
ncbi:MAG: hypothetical protein AAGI53_04930 [Planctomycetota bacterium]